MLCRMVYLLRFDGAFMLIPVVVWAGWLLKDTYGVFHCCGFYYLGESMTNRTEYSPLIAGLSIMKEEGLRTVHMVENSQLVIC